MDSMITFCQRMTVCADAARKNCAEDYYEFVNEYVFRLAASEERLLVLDTDYEIQNTSYEALRPCSGGYESCTLRELIQSRADSGFNFLNATIVFNQEKTKGHQIRGRHPDAIGLAFGLPDNTGQQLPHYEAANQLPTVSVPLICSAGANAFTAALREMGFSEFEVSPVRIFPATMLRGDEYVKKWTKDRCVHNADFLNDEGELLSVGIDIDLRWPTGEEERTEVVEEVESATNESEVEDVTSMNWTCVVCQNRCKQILMMPCIFLSGLCLLAVFIGAIFVFCTGRSLKDFFSALWEIFLEMMED